MNIPSIVISGPNESVATCEIELPRTPMKVAEKIV